MVALRRNRKTKTAESTYRPRLNELIVVKKDHKKLGGKVIDIRHDDGLLTIKLEDNKIITASPFDIIPIDLKITREQCDAAITPSVELAVGQRGFHQYGIQWLDTKRKPLTFKGKTGDDPTKARFFRLDYDSASGRVRFFGELVQFVEQSTNQQIWGLWMWAEYKNRVFQMRSITLTTIDPRLPVKNEDEIDDDGEHKSRLTRYSGIRNLNSDICAAVNIWLFKHTAGGLETIDDLIARVEHPIVRITTISQLDRIIRELVEVREVALRSGGIRYASISSDNSSRSGSQIETREILVSIDFTKQSIINEGKVPQIGAGSFLDGSLATFDATTNGNSEEPNAHALNIHSKMSPLARPMSGGNIMELKKQVARLNEQMRNAASDNERSRFKSEARRLRAMIRKLGGSGGGRGLDE